MTGRGPDRTSQDRCTPPPRRAVVLVADDSPTVRAVARFALEDAGHRVLEAGNGAEALAVLADEAVDVVLLDVEMPVMDGYQTVAALKADPHTADVPVVFLTGRTGSDDVVRGLRLGGHDYLRKPPDPAEMLARVGAAARVKALQDELRRKLDELDLVSRTDLLTGLHNRRHVQEHLTICAAAARRHGHALTVLIVDVDHFKRVNDTVGHAGGDRVLQAVAGALAGVGAHRGPGRALGRRGVPARPAPHRSRGRPRARRAAARHRRRGSSWRSAAGRCRSPCRSAAPARSRPLEGDLLTLADWQLYAAKDAGRDRVRVVLADA